MNHADIIKALQLEALTEEQQATILSELYDVIVEGTMIRIMERMDDWTRDKLQELLDSNAPEEQIDEFIKQHVPDSDKALQETVDELRDDILAVTNK